MSHLKDPTSPTTIERIQDLLWKTRTFFYTPEQELLERSEHDQRLSPTFSSESAGHVQSLSDQPVAEEASVEQRLDTSFTNTPLLDTQVLQISPPAQSSDDYDSFQSEDSGCFPSISCELVLENTSSAPPSHSSDHKTYRSIPRPQFPIRISDGKPPCSPFETSRRWVKWKSGFVEPDAPTWKAEPVYTLIKPTVRPALELLGMDGNKIEVRRLGEGAFNKVYTVSTFDKNGSAKEFIFRAALPANPYYKIECDVATTEFVRNFTTIPVPKIYVYDSSTNNPLGLEWMLMEKAVGVPLADKWVDMDDEHRITLVKQIASWQDALVRTEAVDIGGLYLRWTSTELEFFIGPSNHLVFYLHRRLLHHVNRGPFESIHEFADAALRVQHFEINDPHYRLPFRPKVGGSTSQELCEAIKSHYPHFTDDEVEEYYQNMLDVSACRTDRIENSVKALQEALPRLCEASPIAESGEPMCLAHGDISAKNLLVDDDGNVTALLDWENIEFLPLEFVGMYPRFLESGDVEDDSKKFQKRFDDDPDWWEGLQEIISDIIQTRLRPIYKEHLEKTESLLALCGEGESPYGEFLYRALDLEYAGHDTIEWLQTQSDSETDESEPPELPEGHESDVRELSEGSESDRTELSDEADDPKSDDLYYRM